MVSNAHPLTRRLARGATAAMVVAAAFGVGDDDRHIRAVCARGVCRLRRAQRRGREHRQGETARLAFDRARRDIEAAPAAWLGRTRIDGHDPVTAPDDRTVLFTLKDVYAPFEAAIGAPVFWILPREVIDADMLADERRLRCVGK